MLVPAWPKKEGLTKALFGEEAAEAEGGMRGGDRGERCGECEEGKGQDCAVWG